MDEGLELTIRDETLDVVVDRGEHNRFTTEMARAFADAVSTAERDPRLRFLRLRAKGPAFCLGREPEGDSVDELHSVGARIAHLNEVLRETPLIVVCEVAGDAAGFGVGLVASSDVAIASQRARFWFPELDAGLAPAVVLSWLGHLVPRTLAFDLVASGRKLAAQEALEIGLVTAVAEQAGVAAAADAWLGRLSGLSAPALRDAKAFLGRVPTMDERSAGRSAADTLALGSLRLRESS
jgi:enoyl-CoA hydratase/carnithine racemase